MTKNFKRFFSILIFSTIFSTGNLFAAKNVFDFTISANFGFLNGQISEYVFSPESCNTDDVLSRLDWELKFIPVFDFKATANLLKFAFVGVEGFFSIPCSSGTMQDYDWLNCFAPFNLPAEYGTQVTNYSRHENYLKKFNAFEAKIGANVFLSSLAIDARITPFLAYRYDFIGFDGKNGYRTYKSENWEKISFSGKVISYFQETNSFLLGVDFAVSAFTIFGFSGDFALSPNATFIDALDYHYLTKTAWLDEIKNAFQFKMNLQIDYFFQKRHKFFVRGFFQYVPMQKGADYARSINSEGNFTGQKWLKTDAEGGTSRFILKFSLGYELNLF